MNEKVKVIKVELKQEYGEEKLKTYYPEDVELDDIIMSVYSLLNLQVLCSSTVLINLI